MSQQRFENKSAYEFQKDCFLIAFLTQAFEF